MRRSFLFGLASLLSLGAAGCPVPAVFQPDEPTRPSPPPDPEPAVAQAPTRQRVRVLWRDAVPIERRMQGFPDGSSMTHYVASILGVDPQNRHAYFTRSPMGMEEWFEVVDVPLSAEHPDAQPLSRWIADNHDAGHGAFHSFGGGFTPDLLRYAAILEEVGPFTTRTRGGEAGPHVAVSKDALLFEADPDEMHIADRKGGHVRKFTTARAAYDPLFSPDGTAATFRGCHSVPQVPGKMTLCEYHLYIAAPGDRTPARIPDVIDPQPPVFSPDGRYVYTVTRDASYLQQPWDRGGCLFRADVAPPHAATKLWCTDQHRDLAFHLDPAGATAVVEGKRGTPGTQVLDAIWFDLPSGRVRNTVTIDRGTGLSSLGKGGLFATCVQRGFAFADLATGKVVVVDEPKSTFTLLGDQWADDTSVYALRTRAGKVPSEEIIAIDVRAELDQTD